MLKGFKYREQNFYELLLTSNSKNIEILIKNIEKATFYVFIYVFVVSNNITVHKKNINEMIVYSSKDRKRLIGFFEYPYIGQIVRRALQQRFKTMNLY